LEKRATPREGLALLVDEDMGDIYIAIICTGNNSCKIKQAVSEGEMLLEIYKSWLPTLSMPAQELALDIVDLVKVGVPMIELLPAEKTRENRQLRSQRNILQNTVVAELPTSVAAAVMKQMVKVIVMMISLLK
jgi:hypothetical protein